LYIYDVYITGYAVLGYDACNGVCVMMTVLCVMVYMLYRACYDVYIIVYAL